jgi:plasmid maintenance system killer protein
VDIVFSKKLGKHMNTASSRQRQYGELAKVIGRRLDDLSALTNLEEAFGLPGRFEALSGDRAGQFSIRLSGNWRLILEPANEPLPTRDDGGINPAKVTAIRILEIVDYH